MFSVGIVGPGMVNEARAFASAGVKTGRLAGRPYNGVIAAWRPEMDES
ncbi:hypothetical protein CLJ1_3515 [Pseudomonas paraeruginosa]|nr:hypothetical protein CSC28_3793 [Pseudomonas paraeruginosa]PTC36030.1 hypothetical protein CLJ1_3515 [Pseudomonas aeruginosa]